MSETDNIQKYVNIEGNKDGDEQKMSDYTGQDKKTEMFYGDAMNDNNVNDLVDDTAPHVVILVGFPEYGKSTFVSSFYHAVMKNGTIGKYRFVDSETILGFERRAHIRKEEIKVKKRLDRTQIYDNYFLSLIFVNEETKRKVKLVLSDRSGENYKEYGQTGQKINGDKALNRAQHIIFFLDAHAIATDGFLDMQQRLGLLVPRMSKYGCFTEGKRVDVVFNKIDKVDVNTDTFKSNKEEIVKIIKQNSTVHKIVNLHCINVPLNEDVNKFFEYLLESSEEPENMSDETRQKVDWVSSKLKEIEK